MPVNIEQELWYGEVGRDIREGTAGGHDFRHGGRGRSWYIAIFKSFVR